MFNQLYIFTYLYKNHIIIDKVFKLKKSIIKYIKNNKAIQKYNIYKVKIIKIDVCNFDSNIDYTFFKEEQNKLIYSLFNKKLNKYYSNIKLTNLSKKEIFWIDPFLLKSLCKQDIKNVIVNKYYIENMSDKLLCDDLTKLQNTYYNYYSYHYKQSDLDDIYMYKIINQYDSTYINNKNKVSFDNKGILFSKSELKKYMFVLKNMTPNIYKHLKALRIDIYNNYQFDVDLLFQIDNFKNILNEGV